jgi:alpha-L-fucosidase
MITRRGLLAAAAAFPLRAAAPPPFGALPSPRQLLWHQIETAAFLHFGINTFTGKEWGYGDEDPKLFDPKSFDAPAIIDALAAAGMRAVILTCKHHDGFCLWPTKTTAHNVRASAWRNGQGDVVRDIANAARARGFAFGVYLSPWDRNHSAYGSPEYIKVYRDQLTELLANYGPICEVWHDGANGGDGFYGGAREKRGIDRNTYYDWPKTWELVRSLQPDAVIFSDVGPDIRWVGNEKGIAGDPCWATYDPVGADGGPASPGNVREKESQTGTRHGSRWMPAECDVSIRPGWFWRESENAKVKTAAQLIDLYYASAGRGANLLLNVPPNRDGLLEKEDIESLRAFGAYRRATFEHNLLLKAHTVAGSTRADRRFWAASLVDGKDDTCWAAEDNVRTTGVIVTVPREINFRVILVREAIEYGQRIEQAAVDRWNGRDWETVATFSSIGPRRLIRLEHSVTAQRLRLRITQSAASPALTEFAAFAEP